MSVFFYISSPEIRKYGVIKPARCKLPFIKSVSLAQVSTLILLETITNVIFVNLAALC